jgi:hypothetical protein
LRSIVGKFPLALIHGPILLQNIWAVCA